MPKKSYIYSGSQWVEMTSTSSVGTATTSSAGIVQLLNSANSTSATTAVTPNSVLDSTKNIQKNLYGTTRIGNVPSFYATGGTTGSLGAVRFTRHLPQRNFTVSNISYISTNVVGSDATLIRFGIYLLYPSESGPNFPSMKLVARTASDTTIFTAANTRYTRSLDTTNGYPAQYEFIAGQEYYTAWIQVGGVSPSLMTAPNTSIALLNSFRAIEWAISSQTDLQPFYNTVSSSTGRYYSEVS